MKRKRASEVKRSMRCSEEPVAGAGSMCAAVSVTKKRPHKGGAGISMKRARKPEKPSQKEKGAEEKSKRCKKKRAGEKNKQPDKVEVVHDLSMEEKIMAKLAELDKKMAEEKSKRSNQEKRIEEMFMRIEKIASKIEEQVAGDGMKKEKMTKEKGAKKLEGIEEEMEDNKVMRDKEAVGKKKVVTWMLSQELLDYLRTKEVMGLLASEAPLPLWASKIGAALFDSDQRLKEKIAAEFQENREFDAHVLYQYRTKGYVEIEEEVSDEEVDEELSEKEHDVEADGILVGKMHARKPEKPSKKEKGAEESKRSNQEKRTEEEKNNKVQLAEKNNRLVTAELPQVLMEEYLSDEVLDYMMAKRIVTFGEWYCRRSEFDDDIDMDAPICAIHRSTIETQASVLQQYRTKGSAAIQFYATDDDDKAAE